MSKVDRLANQPINDALIDELTELLYEAASRSSNPHEDIMNQENIPSTQHSLHPAHLVLHSAPECSQRLPSRYYPLIGTPQAPGPSIPV